MDMRVSSRGANLSLVVSELGKRLLIRQVTLKVFVRVSGFARVFHLNQSVGAHEYTVLVPTRNRKMS